MSRSLDDRLAEEFEKKGKIDDLEVALLIASGARTIQDIDAYRRRLDRLHQSFLDHADSGLDAFTTAGALHDFLWTKKRRYIESRSFLTQAIDGQLHPGKAVANCVGLASLYVVLGQRCGIEFSIGLTSDHVYPIVHTTRQIIHVESTEKNGFIRGPHQRGTVSPLTGLAATLYVVRGCEENDHARAITQYTRALLFDSTNIYAYRNRGAARQELGLFDLAFQDLMAAVRLDPDASRRLKAWINSKQKPY